MKHNRLPVDLRNTELNHLNRALQANGYSKNEITRDIKPRKQHRTEEGKQPSTNKVLLPYIKVVTDCMGKLLKKHNLQTVFKPTTKIQQMLQSAKDRRDPSPLQEYTGYLAVVDRYILEPQNAAFTPESKNMRDTAD